MLCGLRHGFVGYLRQIRSFLRVLYSHAHEISVDVEIHIDVPGDHRLSNIEMQPLGAFYDKLGKYFSMSMSRLCCIKSLFSPSKKVFT